jgi:hypothetical protein
MEEQTTVQARILAAWIDFLRRNRGAEGHPEQYYSLNVENILGQGEEFELHVTFRAGRTYCCSKPYAIPASSPSNGGGNCG